MNSVLPYLQADKRLTLKEKIGQLFMPAAFIHDTEDDILRLEQLIQEHHVGGLCFFHSRASAATNYEGKEKVIYSKKSFDTLKTLIQRYQNVAPQPLLMAIDAEWGLAMRIEDTPQYPYSITLGAVQEKTDLIFYVGRNIAHDCRIAGLHWNLAPVVDINNNPDNPVIGYRSFGDHPDLVAKKAIAFVKGIQSMDILTSIKHFPGHGDTAVDSHLGLPLINRSKKELSQNELFPFQELIRQGVDSVMVGHLSVPALANGEKTPSSISEDIIKGILRNELGFEGVVISDALNMRAVSKLYPTKGELEWRAFNAGNDILCFAEHIQEGIDTILKNAKTSQIEESFKRVWKLKEKAIRALPEFDEKCIDPHKLNKSIARESLTFVKGDVSDISKFTKSDFFGVEVSRCTDHHFLSNIQKNRMFDTVSTVNSPISSIADKIKGKKSILLSIFPPNVKPADNFGFSHEEIRFIKRLLKTKNVVLYLFGNPYFLRLINTKQTHATVVAYQQFKVFQEVASKHFTGRIEARGKLPFKLGVYE